MTCLLVRVPAHHRRERPGNAPRSRDFPSNDVRGEKTVMTIRVYEVRADGTTTTIRERREIDPPKGVPATLAYPPCRCPRCGTPADATHGGTR
jgi:hypothetical protein